MPLRFTLDSITSNAGETATLPPSAVTAVVGGNNAGKSRLLQDIELALTQREATLVVLQSLAITKPTPESPEELATWLDAHASRSTANNGGQQWAPAYGGTVLTLEQVTTFMGQVSRSGLPTFSHAGGFFVHRTSAGALAGHAAGAAPVGQAAVNSPTNPLGRLYRDGDIEAELDELARATFGDGLVLDRANAEFRIRVGEVTVPVPPINHPTREYGDALLRLPLLDDQGDGMRSFVGFALLVMASPPPLLLIDEPEAFLHPGQARALGRWLGRAAHDRGIQIVVATHDRDLLLGLLEAEAPVNVIRVVREGDVNRLAQLPPEEIQDVWADPVLRYSNVLQGLFHRQVIVCESDGDCRFFGAALDELALSTDRRSVADDTLFVPGGGKQRVAAIARALGRLQVRSRAIVDFDVFRERDTVRGIVESVGGIWTDDINSDYVAMVRPVQQGSLWTQVKAQGLAAVPHGEPNAAAQRLLDALQEAGVHVVPVGEMEGFDRSQSAHGAAWVSTAIETGVHKTQALTDFVEPLLSS